MHAFVEVLRSLAKTPIVNTLLKYTKSQSRENLLGAFESQLNENVNSLKRQRRLLKPVRIAID